MKPADLDHDADLAAVFGTADPVQDAAPIEEAARAAMRGPLEIAPAGDLSQARVSPVRYVIAPIVPRGVVTLLGAHGGSGKSTLALAWCAHVACGTPWAGLEAAQGRALFVSLEDSAELVRHRLRRCCEAYGLDAALVGEGVTVADGTGMADAAMARETFEAGALAVVATDAFAQVAEAAAGCALVVIDGASDAADLDENRRRSVRAFLRLLASIAREHDAGIVLVAHTDKAAAKFGSQGQSYSGSTAWNNSVRSRLALVEKDGALELVHEKANLSGKAPPIALRFAEGGALLPQGGADVSAATLVAGADARAVLAALQAAHGQGCSVPAGRVGAITAHSTLGTFAALPDPLRGTRGRARFWAALDALLADGRARVETYRSADYKDRRRIVPGDLSAEPDPPIRPSAKSPTPPSNSAGRKPADCLSPPKAIERTFGGLADGAGLEDAA